MGTVYTLPVVSSITLGVSYGSSVDSAVRPAFLSIINTGLHTGVTTDGHGSFETYFAASVGNTRCAFYLSGSAIAIYSVGPEGAIVGQASENRSWEIYGGRALPANSEAAKGISYCLVDYYNSRDEALAALGVVPITYRDTNCTHNGPNRASAGSTVNVTYTFPDGYGIANNSDIYVTNNGVIIPSSYSNGMLTFTMPE